MSEDFLTKRFKLEDNYNWDSRKFLEKSIELVKTTEGFELAKTYSKSPNKFEERLNQLRKK